MRRNIGRLKLTEGLAYGREHALRDRECSMSGDPAEPLGSVCVYLCALLAVIFMWDTSLTRNPAERL